MYLTWQKAQTLMRRRVMRRLIWVYATICKCAFLYFFLHKYINHVTTIAYIEFTSHHGVHCLQQPYTGINRFTRF